MLENKRASAKALHEQDFSCGYGYVYLPAALSRNYLRAAWQWEWQYAFPARNLAQDPRSVVVCRHHVDPSVVNKAIKSALRRAGINKRVTAHTFRHCFGTHLLQWGTDIRTLKTLMGHKDVSTTRIYTHVLRQGGRRRHAVRRTGSR